MLVGANTLLTQWEEKAIVSPSYRTHLRVYGQELFAIWSVFWSYWVVIETNNLKTTPKTKCLEQVKMNRNEGKWLHCFGLNSHRWKLSTAMQKAPVSLAGDPPHPEDCLLLKFASNLTPLYLFLIDLPLKEATYHPDPADSQSEICSGLHSFSLPLS